MSRTVPTARPVAHTLWASFAVPLACLLVSGVVGAIGLAVGVRGFEDLTRREVPLLTTNAEILQALTDAESAERGFLITADPAFLEPYEPARATFYERLEAASGLSDAGPLAPLFAAQHAAGAAWFEFGDAVIELRRSDAAAAFALAQTGAGRDRFEAFREVSTQTEVAIRDELAARLAHARTTAAVAGFVLGSLVLVALIGGAQVALRATRTVTQPLDRLVEVLRRLRSADYDARFVQGGPAEIAAVGEAVNQLATAAGELTRSQEKRLEVGRQVRQVSSTLHRLLGVQPVVDAVVDELGRSFGGRAVVRRIAGQDQRILAQWCADGVPELSTTGGLDYPATLLDLVVAAANGPQGAAVIADVATDERLDTESAGFLAGTGVRAALTSAVRTGSGAILVVAVHDLSGSRDWSESDVALFEGLVREAATALANAAVFENQHRVVERLEQLDRDKTTFMSNVSHELRTPLTSIMGYLELLQDGDAGELSRDQLGLLGTIDRNSKRLLDLIEDLLILSRIEGGMFTMDQAPVEVASALQEVLTSLRPQYRSRSVDLVVEAAPDLGTVVGDERQLERVLLNLLSNAVKFTAPGGRVVVEGRIDGAVVEVSVADNGIGIPHDEQHRLFERFFRSSTAQAQAIQGTGLGLAISKTIVERHGGTLHAASTPDVGTTFVVRFPLVDASSMEGTASCLSSAHSS